MTTFGRVINSRTGTYRPSTAKLDTYLIANRGEPTTLGELHTNKRGIAYTESAYAYLFQKTTPTERARHPPVAHHDRARLGLRHRVVDRGGAARTPTCCPSQEADKCRVTQRPPTIRLERNKQVALEYIHEGIGRQDMSAFRHLRPDARFWQNGHRLELAGYHTLKETVPLAEKTMAGFPDGMTFEILTVTAEQNRVLVEVNSDARLANGNPYRNQYVFSFYFDNQGRITEFREFWDTRYAFETMFEGRTEL